MFLKLASEPSGWNVAVQGDDPRVPFRDERSSVTVTTFHEVKLCSRVIVWHRAEGKLPWWSSSMGVVYQSPQHDGRLSWLPETRKFSAQGTNLPALYAVRRPLSSQSSSVKTHSPTDCGSVNARGSWSTGRDGVVG